MTGTQVIYIIDYRQTVLINYMVLINPYTQCYLISENKWYSLVTNIVKRTSVLLIT